jgi:two-component system nitrate/nitrite response regulator NarL
MARQRVNPPLNDVQMRILELLVAGATNRAIAEHLGLSIHTVKRQVTKLLDVLNCENRTLAAMKAVRSGLI